jgi:hypothetical protein
MAETIGGCLLVEQQSWRPHLLFLHTSSFQVPAAQTAIHRYLRDRLGGPQHQNPHSRLEDDVPGLLYVPAKLSHDHTCTQEAAALVRFKKGISAVLLLGSATAQCAAYKPQCIGKGSHSAFVGSTAHQGRHLLTTVSYHGRRSTQDNAHCAGTATFEPKPARTATKQRLLQLLQPLLNNFQNWKFVATHLCSSSSASTATLLMI